MPSLLQKFKESKLVKGTVYAIVGAFSYPGINVINKLKINGTEHIQDLPKKKCIVC